MKVSWSLLLLALVTASPILAAEDEIWGSAAREETKTAASTVDTSSTEQDAIDPMPGPTDGAGSEEDEAD